MTCTTHHDACTCRRDLVIALVQELATRLANCPDCRHGVVLERHRCYPRTCPVCLEGRRLLRRARRAGWAE